MKNQLNKLLGIVLIFTVSIFLFSCDGDDNGPSGQYANGAFIMNEGAFNGGNASVSFYSYEGDSISNDIFFNQNNRPLGDVLQSAISINGLTYMVLNASGKIEIVNSTDFSQVDTVGPLSQPRYIDATGGFAYVTQWGEGGVVKVINLNANDISSTIEVGTGPEDILLANNQLYVANSGSFGLDSTVMIIDPSQNTVTDTIQTGYNPNSLTVDSNGDIWVLCSGKAVYDNDFNIIGHKPSRLDRINATTGEVTKTIPLFDEQHPIKLDISSDGETLFVGGGYGFPGIYAIGIDDTEVPASPLINKSFYGFSVNPMNGEIYAMEAPSFTDNGIFHRYQENGNLIDSYEVGIGPNGAIF